MSQNLSYHLSQNILLGHSPPEKVPKVVISSRIIQNFEKVAEHLSLTPYPNIIQKAFGPTVQGSVAGQNSDPNLELMERVNFSNLYFNMKCFLAFWTG